MAYVPTPEEERINRQLHETIKNVEKSRSKSLILDYKLEFNGIRHIYRIKSKLSFGKYHGEEIGLVYKIDPSYIEWALEYAEGVCLHPDDFEFMRNIEVFYSPDLEPFLSEKGNEILLNLRGFSIKDNFYVNSNIGEEAFYFSQLAINENEIRLKTSLNATTIMNGADWYSKKFRGPKKNSKVQFKTINRKR